MSMCKRMSRAFCTIVVISLAFSLILLSPGISAGSDLVLHLPLDEGTGSTAQDLSSCGNDGIIHGATWVGGKYGNALSFDGQDDYVDCGNDASLDITDAITIEAWINTPGTGDKTQDIVAKTYGNGKISYIFRYYQSTGKLSFIAYDGTAYGMFSASTISLNQWQHVAVTFDSSTIYFYINGVSDGPYSFGLTSLPVNDEPLYIGTYNFSEFFNGIIDEVRIYNRALTAQEILGHYNANFTPDLLDASPVPAIVGWGIAAAVVALGGLIVLMVSKRQNYPTY